MWKRPCVFQDLFFRLPASSGTQPNAKDMSLMPEPEYPTTQASASSGSGVLSVLFPATFSFLSHDSCRAHVRLRAICFCAIFFCAMYQSCGLLHVPGRPSAQARLFARIPAFCLLAEASILQLFADRPLLLFGHLASLMLLPLLLALVLITSLALISASLPRIWTHRALLAPCLMKAGPSCQKGLYGPAPAGRRPFVYCKQPKAASLEQEHIPLYPKYVFFEKSCQIFRAAGASSPLRY